MNPERKIIRNKEEYLYIGDVPKTRAVLAQELKNESGRKVIFLNGCDGWVCVYISKIFYPSLCNTMYPYHGTEVLV
jgi:hypothetical protein